MIKVKFKALEKSDKDLEFDVNDGELLSRAFDRSLVSIDTGEFKKDEVFKVILNGEHVDKELFENIKLKKDDNVLIHPIVKGGEATGIFRTITLIAVAIMAPQFATAAWGLTGTAAALVGLGATMTIGLLMNGLISPPNVPSANTVSSGEESQMYSITGQQNIVKKLSTVPKVYGKHRVFPTIAANPYTQLENDSNGELVQYLYAIYDFGLGPCVVDDLQIGETSILEFTDIEYRFVDINRPATDEGPWDFQLFNEFILYKNDVETEALNLALNGDSSVSGTPVDEYRAERTSAPNVDSVSQTIVLNFANPEGLVGIDSQGQRVERSIDLKIQFKLTGSTVWRNYNDPTYVKHFTSVGGKPSVYGGTQLTPLPLPDLDNPNPYSVIYSTPDIVYNIATNEDFFVDPEATSLKKGTKYYGFPAGSSVLYIADNPSLTIGSNLFIYEEFVGKIVANAASAFPGYRQIVLDAPLAKSIIFFAPPVFFNVRSDGSIVAPGVSQFTDTTVGRFFVNSASTGLYRITATSSRPVYSTFSFTPKDVGQFDIRVERVQTIGTFGPDKSDKLTWTSLSTRLETLPIATEKRHRFLEMRIKATNQLNGNIDNLSGIVTSALEVYDDVSDTWTRQLTNNPAWVFTDLLTGEVNKRPLDKTRLDTTSILEWANYCAASPTPPTGITLNFPRYECNFVLDYRTTLQEVLNQVANSCQATLNLVDGKYGVILDIDRVTPVQLFTPRNSKDFSVTRNYSSRPHALKVRFIDPSKNWELDDKIVYDDGFNSTNATDFDTIETFACTNQEQAWRFGRFMLAQNRYRQEVMTLTVDFEHLICTRGDFVQISQDVMRVGGRPARVKAVAGLTVTIDDSLDFPVGPTFAYVYRDTNTGDITQAPLTPLTPNSFTADVGSVPSVGDLIVIGETDSVVFDCIVKSITPNDDLSAQLVLVERAEQVYQYESDNEFVPYDPKISLISDPNAFPPSAVENLTVVESNWMCNGAGYDFFVDLDWDYPVGSVFEFFEIYVDYGLGYILVDNTNETEYHYVLDDTDFLGNTFNFKVLAVSATGRKLPLGEAVVVSTVLNDKTDPPSDVVVFGTDITNEVLQLSWDRIADCDASEYLIRFSPNLNSAWSSTIPLMRVDSNTSTISTQARSGVYLIKAIDFNGNESLNAARAVTTIPELFNLNIIDTITDAPTFVGTKENIEVSGAALILKESVSGGPATVQYFTPGYYYYNNLLDIGDIYTVRLQSLIEAEGYNIGDLMVNWVTLASVPTISTVGVSDWEVQTQYRSTDVYNTISLWPSLDVIDALSEGFEDLWTDWRPFTMGDATGRIFQFRLKLISNKVNVSPRVFEATIKADMPDRVDNYNNLVSDASLGYTVTYSPAFKGPGSSPNIQVSVENAQSGDYWTFTSKTLTGFTIKFFNSSDVGVSRTFDVMVKGYGRKSTTVI